MPPLLLLLRVAAAATSSPAGAATRVPAPLANLSLSWRMDGAMEERGVEEALFGSAVGRPAAVEEILETFLDALT